ncbi:DUF58 domain-containing protein [Rhodopirellula sp. MGV]|uniref:DUF58 domain-containing protein n=1 Tax=Rhodopirellula sp. MGV TaxID=2023130 RepID=UPI000B9669C7|nr:DUF58 domain-containing protein [Rhodopirellula sp. MGV]OYP28844.1 DUF58 domain-containing protein [Rhodopirellula sp. MGV]PNY37563.1 DUF58 domain-containing protein [Rhodopirellula baltica]
MIKPANSPGSQSPPAADASHSEPSGLFKLLAAASAVLLIGLLFGASLWVLTAIVAASVILLNQYLAKTWATATIATRHGRNEELHVGESFSVKLSLQNTSRLPVVWLLVEDLVPHWATIHDPPTLKVTGERVQVLLLWPNQTRDLEYTVKCNRRGYFQIGPTVLETGDVMGLYRRFRVGTEPQYITVLPKVLPLEGYDIASPRPMGEIRMRANVLEDPTRLRGIRQWQPGDPMRRVHWSATARTGILHSKVYEPTSIAGATLVLDLHVETNPTNQEPIRTDLAITTAASIASSLMEQSQPFAMVTNGRDAADRIRTDGWRGDHRIREQAQRSAQRTNKNDRLRPVIVDVGRGPLQFQKLRTQLARLERSDGMSFAQLLIEAESRISSETTLIAIFQKATPETIATLVGFARRGKAVAAVINTIDFNEFGQAAGPLIAANIPTMQLADENSIRDVCRASVGSLRHS